MYSNFRSQLRGSLTRRGATVITTTLVILVLLSLMTPRLSREMTLSPVSNAKPNDSDQESLGETNAAKPTVISDVVEQPPADPTNSPEKENVAGKFQPMSTNNHGKLVMLTGSSGASHFRTVQDYFSKVLNNRLDYANSHGTNSNLQKGF